MAKSNRWKLTCNFFLKLSKIQFHRVQMKHNFFALDQMERLLTNVFKNHDGIKIQIDDIIPFRSEAILDRFLVFLEIII